MTMRRAMTAAAALAMLGSVVAAGSATAEDFTQFYPAGTACDFPIRIDGGGGHRTEHTITNKHGTVFMSTGTGSELTFTNEDSGATVWLRSKGAVVRTTTLADGSDLFVLNGHNVVILFPSDVPAGPSTTLYSGKVTFTVNPQDGQWTILDTNGLSRDLCAELSG
ncbi:hypothetical protein GA707_16975 [Nostocoides sp. F2B08]|uniref:hypothetical protein n=1 Tax=Nostocoides sp. F2B08 TaxID=2653936 RepID=UPI001263A847|nr:hypothetical protein [Tetrasphaera sp. F2B08]KAB7741905.1 hypothetical protein GA707_16975 [Tetrasphaera sp. F2B08]